MEKTIATDCMGVGISVGNHVMFATGTPRYSTFKQGIVNSLKKCIVIAELDGKGELVYLDKEKTTLKTHRRNAVGVIRVFTQQEHEEMNIEAAN